jgi:hypothetical protein
VDLKPASAGSIRQAILVTKQLCKATQYLGSEREPVPAPIVRENWEAPSRWIRLSRVQAHRFPTSESGIAVLPIANAVPRQIPSDVVADSGTSEGSEERHVAGEQQWRSEYFSGCISGHAKVFIAAYLSTEYWFQSTFRIEALGRTRYLANIAFSH